MRKRLFLKNAAVLIAVSFFTRASSIAFRVYLSGKLGAAGMGAYQLVFSVFVTAVAFSTAGMNLLSMRLSTRSLALDPAALRGRLMGCIRYGLVVSAAAEVLMCIFARPVAIRFLNDGRMERSLRILALGLPFMSCCSVFKGFFTAVKKTVHCAAADILEQAVTIGVPIVRFLLHPDEGLQSAVEWLMIGSTLGEVSSFLYGLLLYRILASPFGKKRSESIRSDIRHIALPGTVSSTARTLLNTAENLLIPYTLRLSGMGAEASLSRYGMLQGMALPTLIFPSSLLLPFSSLLVPEIAEALEKGERKSALRLISRALSWTMRFSLFAACVFFSFSGELGERIYKSGEVGLYLKILAPLAVLMYADSVVDGILKGLDQQIASCRYNLIDGALRVILILVLVPRTGIAGYIAVLFFSTIFNASLSFSRLLKTSQIVFPVFEAILLPLAGSAASVCLSRAASGLSLEIRLLFCAALYVFLLTGGRMAACRRKERRARCS